MGRDLAALLHLLHLLLHLQLKLIMLIFISGAKPVVVKVGMTTSNEPGYYEDGEFGLRIEK